MADAEFDPGSIPSIVPMFPLPNVVLFPKMFLPLHIFEPRYRALTKSALEGERFIAMALFQSDWKKDYAGCPAVRPVLGLGRIIEDTRLADGRYNLVLYGVARLRLLKEVSTDPYRSVQVEPLREKPAGGAGYDRKRRLLLAFYVQVLKQVSQGALASPPQDVPLGLLCDLLASLIAFDPGVKQALLEELDVAARCDLLLDLLQRMNAPGLGGTDDDRKRPWPPGPSLN
ncbi:MAG TPA: LON peptidase substrate-binding domain-containing protein [Planctomycetota bacterium]|nr:LON peptidase substrate-binding domain-containing protein [Planctomycetota bacterium]